MEYPRGDSAVITDAESGKKREITAGDTSNALFYELQDAVSLFPEIWSTLAKSE